MTTSSVGGDVVQGACTSLHEETLPSNIIEVFMDGHQETRASRFKVHKFKAARCPTG